MNKYLNSLSKKAGFLNNEKTREAAQIGIIGATGAGTGMLASKIAEGRPMFKGPRRMGALLGGLGLAGDYLAMKANKKIDSHFGKQASEMTNKYLEKIAGELAKGWISPTWMEEDIAKQHGQEVAPGGTGRHFKNTARANGRSIVEAIGGGAVGALAGYGAGKISGRNPKASALAGALAGWTGGAFHGTHTSLKNQAAEMHEQYRQKRTKK